MRNHFELGRDAASPQSGVTASAAEEVEGARGEVLMMNVAVQQALDSVGGVYSSGSSVSDHQRGAVRGGVAAERSAVVGRHSWPPRCRHFLG